MKKFCSTRGGVKGTSFQQALLSEGYAADGGLFLPEQLPTFTAAELQSLSALSYADLLENILGRFISPEELSPHEIHGKHVLLKVLTRDANHSWSERLRPTALLGGCFSQFKHLEIVPITRVGTIRILELWHGPTGAFKDLALSVTSCLVNHFLQKQGTIGTAVVATSGDTGSSAIHYTRGKGNLNTIALYPRGRVTRVQELQMTTVDAPNVRVYSIVGTSDDLDHHVKKVFLDKASSKKHTLLTLNSINVSRVMLQVAHYVYGYLKLCQKADKEVTFCVPAGGLGNLTAGYMAHLMGLPIKLVASTNENDTTHRALATGNLSLLPEVLHTYSSAMDIQFPPNIERILYYMAGGQTGIVKTAMERFEEEGSCQIPQDILRKSIPITTQRVSTDETLATMKQAWKDHSYAICPHTACAMHAALELSEDKAAGDIIVIATATLAKFPEAAEKAGVPTPHNPTIMDLYNKPEKGLFMKDGEDVEKLLREAIEEMSQQQGGGVVKV